MERTDNDRERAAEQRCTTPAQIAPSVAVLAEVKRRKAKRRRMPDDNGWERTMERVDNDRERTVEQRCTAPAQIAPSVAVPAALAGQRL